jgi:ribosome-associated translation inhibitor RaiA
MITDSFSASCYVKNDNGKYHVECDMKTNDGDVFSACDGDNFVTCLNTLMDDIQGQLEEKAKPKKMTLEEQVVYLTNLVNDLKDDKAALVNEINALKANKEEKNENKSYKIDQAVVNLSDVVDKLMSDSKNYNSTKATDPIMDWPFKFLVNYND